MVTQELLLPTGIEPTAFQNSVSKVVGLQVHVTTPSMKGDSTNEFLSFDCSEYNTQVIECLFLIHISIAFYSHISTPPAPYLLPQPYDGLDIIFP